nr:PaaI family thioesterase [Candidatus Sigynarchaeota archaeon]
MPSECKTREPDDEMQARSAKILDLFNAIKGQPLGKFPGPIPPFSKWLNGRIVAARRGEVEVELDVRPEMANPTGLLHGGMQAAMLDDIIGITSATLGHKGFLISIDTNINFLGKVHVGDKVLGKGHIAREGNNVVHATAELIDATGNTVATASSNLLITTKEPDFIKNLKNENG